MSVINKQLYDALLAAKVPDDLATRAAESISIAPEDLNQLKLQLSSMEARLALVEKLQWPIFVGVIGLLIKAYFL